MSENTKLSNYNGSRVPTKNFIEQSNGESRLDKNRERLKVVASVGLLAKPVISYEKYNYDFYSNAGTTKKWRCRLKGHWNGWGDTPQEAYEAFMSYNFGEDSIPRAEAELL